MTTLRNWLAAHEAGHITYVEMHSSLVEYGYIDDKVKMDGNARLYDPLTIDKAEFDVPAAGAAGEFAYYLNEVGNAMPMDQFIRAIIGRTATDRDLFYLNMDYDGLVSKGITETKELYFIKWAKVMVHDKYIVKAMPLFNSIKAQLNQKGFIGRSALDAIKHNRVPSDEEVYHDYNRIPSYIRENIRSEEVDLI